MTAELAKDHGDITAVWRRLKETDLQITEWRGTSAFVSAPTGPGAADHLQISLGREIEWRAGPIVNPDLRPYGEEELLDPSWPRTDQLPDSDRLSGHVYRLLGRAGGAVIHLRSFLNRCGRVERKKREAKRSELERRVIREMGPGCREPSWNENIELGSDLAINCENIGQRYSHIRWPLDRNQLSRHLDHKRPFSNQIRCRHLQNALSIRQPSEWRAILAVSTMMQILPKGWSRKYSPKVAKSTCLLK